MLTKPETKRLLQVIEFLERSETAEQIATNIGSYPSAITDLKKGRANAGKKLIQKFTKKYEININWLYTGEGEMFSRTATSSLSKEYPINELKTIQTDIALLKEYVLNVKKEYDTLHSTVISMRANMVEEIKKIIKKEKLTQ